MSFAFFEDMNMAAIVICIKWNRHKNKSPEKSQLTHIYFAIITIAKLKTIFQTSIKIAQKHLGQRAFFAKCGRRSWSAEVSDLQHPLNSRKNMKFGNLEISPLRYCPA